MKVLVEVLRRAQTSDFQLKEETMIGLRLFCYRQITGN